MRPLKSILTIIVCFFICASISFGETTPPLPDCPDRDPVLDPPCPIDGGVSLLIAASIGIGARKAYQERNKSKVLAPNND